MQDYLSMNRKAYNHAANEYAARLQEYTESDVRLLQPFISYMQQVFPRSHILEPGPGSGLALHMFDAAGFQTSAVEIAENIIEVARRNSSNTQFIHDDFLQHELGDQKFEGVFAKAFIHLFPKDDAVRIVKKIYTMLPDRGGLFVATTIHEKSSEGYEEKLDYDDTPVRYRKKWTEQELMDLFRDGWDVINANPNQERGKQWLALTLAKKAAH